MLNKNTTKFTALGLLLFANINAFAQTFGLQSAGEKMLNEVAGAFPFIAGLLFIFAAWRALAEYNENGKDVWSGVKVILFYIIILLVVIGAYKFVKSQGL